MFLFSFAVAGVLFVRVHKGSKLIPMDPDGLSDPYVMIFANKELVSCIRNFLFSGAFPLLDMVIQIRLGMFENLRRLTITSCSCKFLYTKIRRLPEKCCLVHCILLDTRQVYFHSTENMVFLRDFKQTDS